MRVAVYTCVTGGYDKVAAPEVSSPNVDFFCYSDAPLTIPTPWRATLLHPPGLVGNEINRYAKMLPHRLPELASYDVSIYLDASIVVRQDMHAYALEKFSDPGASILMFPHPFRKTLFDEAASISDAGHEWIWRVARQMRRYGSTHSKQPLFAGGVILRRHDQAARRFGEFWWSEFLRESRRDQLSLGYSAQQSGTVVGSLGAPDPFFEQRFFRLRPHKTRKAFSKSFKRFVNLSIALLFGYPRLFAQPAPTGFVPPAKKILKKLASSKQDT